MKGKIFLLFLFLTLISLCVWIGASVNYPQKTSTISRTTSKVQLSNGDTPDIPFILPKGFTIHVFARNLGQARDMVFSPEGTLVVSNPNDGQIIALPDTNHDGKMDTEKIVIDGLTHPHGLAFYGKDLFVTTTTQVIRYTWNEEKLEATKDKILFSLPANNNHNNRTIVFDTAGNMYVSVGSTCNVCHETDPKSATLIISNSNGDNPRIFAKGLRNAAFMTFQPKTKQLWVTEMGRDYLGDITPPDELDIIKENGNYGWPICFGEKIHDTEFDKNIYKQNPCNDTQAPIFEIPAHSAPLGLTFITSSQFPADWQSDLLVAYHGSWNRSQPIGYKIVHLKINGDQVLSSENFLTGFLPTNASSGNDALGRPVDVIFDTTGNLYVSDDKAGSIYIIQKTN